MAQNTQLQQWLESGIAAARRGDKTRARSYFEAVLRADENNELAWIWMASVVTGMRERRACLERVLRINPNNARAREALNALVGVTTTTTMGAYNPEDIQRGAGEGIGERAVNLLTGLLGGVAIIVVILLGSTLLNPPPATVVSSTQVPSATPLLYTNTPAPTATFPGVEVALDQRTLATLPPESTATVTPSPTATLPPTATPLSISEFEVMMVVRADTEPQGELLQGLAEGGNLALLGEPVREARYSADGSQIVFVRDVNYGDGEVAPMVPEATASVEDEAETSTALTPTDGVVSEIFIAPADDLGTAQQLTTLRIADAYQPSLSPDGRFVVFVSEYNDNDEELYLLEIATLGITPLTDNDWVDREPHWSPDGTQIVFTSDRESPGFTELYVYDLTQADEESEPVTRLTNDNGNSYMPRWSPDGTQIAYINDGTGDGDLYITTAQGTRTLLVIGDDRADDRAPVWSPDGRYIAFISNREDDRFQVYIANVRGDDDVRRIFNDARNALGVDFRPDARFRSE